MWITFAFLSATLLGCYDVAKKHALRENAVLPVLFLNTLLCALFFFPFILSSAAGWIEAGNFLYIPPAGWAWHGWVMLKAIVVLSSWLCGYYAIKHLPITMVGPVNATRPIMTLLGALFLFGERLNAWQWAGVLLALGGLYLLSRTGKKEGIRFTRNRWVLFLLGAAVFGAVSGLYDKYLMMPATAGGIGMDRCFIQGWYNVYQALFMGIVLLAVWYPTRHRTTPFHWQPSILLISLFLTAADMAYYYALTDDEALISIVSMVRRSSVLVSFGVGAWLFQERHLRSKAIDLLLVLLSLLCLFIGTWK